MRKAGPGGNMTNILVQHQHPSPFAAPASSSGSEWQQQRKQEQQQWQPQQAAAKTAAVAVANSSNKTAQAAATMTTITMAETAWAGDKALTTINRGTIQAELLRRPPFVVHPDACSLLVHTCNHAGIPTPQMHGSQRNGAT